jgi:hypothetical protein
MNYIYITRSENNDISDRRINDYFQHITDEAKTSLCLNKIKDDRYNDADIAEFLEHRFDKTKGMIKDYVDKLLNGV